MKKRVIPYQLIKTMSRFLIVVVFISLSTEAGAASSKRKGWLGVQIQELTPSLKEALKVGDRTGLLIAEVIEGSPADKADLYEKDVILTYDGQPVEKADDFARMVRNTPPDKTIKLDVLRDGEKVEIEVTIGKRKYRRSKNSYVFFGSDRPRLGVKVHELNEDLAHYFDVDKNKGVLILEVIDDSPAEKGGLKAGDIISKINNEHVADPDELIEILGEYEEGDVVTVEYVRHGKTAKIELELEDSESQDSPFWKFFNRPRIDIHRFDDKDRSKDIEIIIPKSKDRYKSIESYSRQAIIPIFQI